MHRRLTLIALVLGLWGCGGEEERIKELVSYVRTIQAFDSYNKRVEVYILQFDEVSIPVTHEDLEKARALLEEYAVVVAEADIGDGLDDSMLRNTHGLYIRTFDETRILARDETGDMRRQAQSIAIGFRNLRRSIEDRVYPSIDVLLAREGLDGGENALVWPKATSSRSKKFSN